MIKVDKDGNIVAMGYFVEEPKRIRKTYKKTDLDCSRKKVDFLLKSIDGNWYSIWFNNPVKLKVGRSVRCYGNSEQMYSVTERVFDKIKEKYTWECDF